MKTKTPKARVMSSATPRTKAATSFYEAMDRQNSFYYVEPEDMAKLETELAEAKAIHAELEDRHLQLILARSCGYPSEIPASERAMQAHAVQSLHAELARLRAEVERLSKQLRDEESWWKEKHDYQARAERAEVEVERLTVADHAWRTAAKFDAHNAEVLRAEIGRLNTQIATHIRERDGYYEGSVSLRTRAEKAETALTNAKKDSERLNRLLDHNVIRFFASYSDRAAIDSAKGTSP